MLALYGNPQSSPVVFLHGFLGTNKDWKTVVERLQDDWFCIVPDLPGHGVNTTATSMDCIDVLVNEVYQAIEALVTEPFHLIGYSMGGRLAMKLAHDHPDAVASLCLESAHPGLLSQIDKENRIKSDVQWGLRFKHEAIDKVLADWYQQPVFGSLNQQQRDALIASHKKQSITSLISILEKAGLGKQRPYWDFLAKWEKPLLYINGQGDRKFTNISKQLKERCLHAQFLTISDASHNTHFAQPEQFIHNINAFLRA